ncbi:MAG: ABC transporter permease, partial [Sandarakinorhabdus sp.]|nr:ABC transporter permease [Sandarakinorhabdus sp.]
IGCGIGVALGAGLSMLAGKATGLETPVSLFAVSIAFAVSALIRIFFGWWPATRAAKLGPIEALRS